MSEKNEKSENERYLLCRVAQYVLAIRAGRVRRLWPIEEEMPEPFAAEPVADLRVLLDHDDFGSNQSKVINVIDSKSLERDLSEKPASTFSHPALDAARAPGIGIAIEMPAGNGVLIVDQIIRLAHLAEDAFFALPPVFEGAAGLFDAACRQPVEGSHPLRLRDAPHCLRSQAAAAPL